MDKEMKWFMLVTKHINILKGCRVNGAKEVVQYFPKYKLWPLIVLNT